MSKPPLIILSGPTAVGKTELSIKLAKSLSGEIISADSMQVYKGMDIGTAKIMEDEKQGIVHHLIDIIQPFEEWNVKRFKEEAKNAVSGILSKGRIPIVTGGTGFYIQALLYDVDFTEENDDSIRKRLYEEAESKGCEVLYNRLREADPESAAGIHPNNVKRVIRALEYLEQTGQKISEHNHIQRTKESPYAFAYMVLNDDRGKVYERIDRRVDIMLENGLVKEVEDLMNAGLDLSYASMQGLGYKEIYRYLTGELSFDEAVYILKRDTRHFAKRQLTWFRRERDACFFDRQEYADDDALLGAMLEYINKRMTEEDDDGSDRNI